MKYTFIKEKYIDEIDSNVKIYKHNKSGARICVMENDDENKVFSIAFRTPAINNCGLTHILEHSVLCGSKKYPVKDPFVSLLKSSLNTFINAFTFPDKTMYPCASLNDKDFKNLMSVYMDAVFYPNIYKYKEIFYQEGWHYELKDKNDDIKINGVVYNEMKGAFSNPEETLTRHIMHSLYPNTAYGLESGGDPDYIPDLSYEEFINFHKKYYSPSNSYIYIYGNCDMEERLDWLDKEYLSKFDVVDFDSSIKPQKAFDEAKYVTEYYQADGNLDNKTFLSYNTVLPSILDSKKIVAAGILIDALFNIPGAKLKEKIQQAGIGSSVNAIFETDLYEPFLSIVVQGSNADKEEKLIDVIDSYLYDLVKNGVDKDSILSLINHTEFENREKMFSASWPKGLMIQISGISTWLYDDNEPFKGLESLEIYKELKNDLLNSRYFEDLIDEYILNNNHKSFVKLIPTLDYQDKKDECLKEKLAEYKKSLSDKELDDLIKLNADLEKYQSEEDSEEALNTLPRLSLEDLNPNPKEYKLDVFSDNYKVLYSNYHTNDIAYIRYVFDITNISNGDLNALSLYTALIRQMNTDKYSYFEINQMILNELGGIGAEIVPVTDVNKNVKCYLVLSVSCLKDKIDFANDLLLNIIKKTDFSDTDRLYKRLAEIKNAIENSIVGRGHVVAITRAASFTDLQFNIRDNIGGIAYLDYIEDVYKNFDSYKKDLIKDLENMKNVFAKNNFTVSITGNEEIFTLAKASADKFYNELDLEAKYNRDVFMPQNKSEAIKTTYNVNYVARCGKFSDKYTGASLVLENALSLDYLWQNVRVLGGAYGCMLQVMPQGGIGFTSYRDPNIDRTNNVYSETPKFIDEMDITEEDLLEFKIGAIGNSQIVEHVRDMSKTAAMLYFKGATYDYRKNVRKELLEATADDLKNMSKWYKEALADSSVVVLGNANLLDKSEIKFDSVRNLIKD